MRRASYDGSWLEQCRQPAAEIHRRVHGVHNFCEHAVSPHEQEHRLRGRAELARQQALPVEQRYDVLPDRPGQPIDRLQLELLSTEISFYRDRAGFLTGGGPDQLTVLADRLYDREIPVSSSGVPLDQLFPAAMLAGGYRKKYLRAISRLTALAREP